MDEHTILHLARVDRKMVDGEQVEVTLTLLRPEGVIHLTDNEEFATVKATYNLFEDPR